MEREGLHDCIRLIPEVSDVRPYLRAADIFVCASRVEAFSRSVLEAEAFGLPVVSTPCCGLNEQVVWGHNALRFEMGDSRLTRWFLRRLKRADVYHVLKHKKRMRPDELSEEERRIVQRRSTLIRVHRIVTWPYFKIRRSTFKRLRASGRLLPEGSK